MRHERDLNDWLRLRLYGYSSLEARIAAARCNTHSCSKNVFGKFLLLLRPCSADSLTCSKKYSCDSQSSGCFSC